MKNLKLISAFAAFAMAAAPLAALANDVKVLLDGKALEFDVPPQIIEERTMVPLRVIFESLGAAVEWEGETRTITAVKGDTAIKLVIGENIIYINNEAKELDVAPLIIDERTLVPVRAVAESFGTDVDWDGNTQTVILTSPAEDVPPESAPPSKPDGENPPAPTDAPPSPTASAAVSEIPIDVSSDLMSASVANFKLTGCERTGNDYKITYTFETFIEGSGSVTAKFNCLDADGRTVDSFGGTYKSVDYTFTEQKGESVISGKTVKIVLAKPE